MKHSLCFQAGVEGRPVVFLLPDSKIVCEGLLEDVNNLLNSGEVRRRQQFVIDYLHSV